MSDKPAWMEKATILIVGSKNRVKKMWRNLFNIDWLNIYVVINSIEYIYKLNISIVSV